MRNRSCNIVLNVHAPTEEKTDDTKDSFYEELGNVLDQFLKYHKKTLLGDFNIKVGREVIFKLRIDNESLHEISNNNRVVNFATSKNLFVKRQCSHITNIHKYTWTSNDAKISNQTDHIFTDRRRTEFICT
jgi:hypothetical protein